MDQARAANKALPVVRTTAARPALAGPTLDQPANMLATMAALQRLAGNRAVTGRLVRVQRDAAGGQEQDIVKYIAEKWPERVTGRLVSARENMKERVFFEAGLFGAMNFVLKFFPLLPQSDPGQIKVRIFGRGLEGVYDLYLDRRKKKNTGTGVAIADDFRTWRYQAVELGPSLKVGAGGSPASLDKWNDGVVYPLGRALLKSDQDPQGAVHESSVAYEIIHMWREATPRDDPNRLELANLERGVYTSFQRVRQLAYGKSEVDLGQELDKTIAESKVIESVVAAIQPPKPEAEQASQPAPSAPPPFENDTELERP